MNATDAATSPGGHDAGESQPVIGTTIFWILLTLCITSAWHPLGSSAGFSSKLRRHVRTMPLTTLLDTILLYTEVATHFFQTKQHRSFHNSAQSVAIRRLRINTAVSDRTRGYFELLGSRDSRHADGTPADWWLRSAILSIGMDMRPRLLSNALVVFVYTKMFAISGAPFSLAIATLYFLSWVGSEAFLFILFGVTWARNTRQLLALIENDHEDDTILRRGPPLPIFLRKIRLETWSAVLLVGQLAALVAVGIWIIAARSRPAPSPPSPPSPPPEQPGSPPDTLLVAISSLLWRIIKWVATPATWWVEHVGDPMLKPESGLWRLIDFPPLLIMILSITILIPLFFLGLLAIIAAVVIIGTPLVLAVVLAFVLCKGVASVPAIVHGTLRAVFSTAAVVWWARAGSVMLVVATAVYYSHLWNAEGTSKAGWAEHLG